MKVKAILNDGTSVYKNIPTIFNSFVIGNESLTDVKVIGETAFSLEDLLHDKAPVKEIRIPLYGNYSNLPLILSEFFEFLFSKDIAVKVVKNPQQLLPHEKKGLLDNYTCLFSGGMDSFSGILTSEIAFKKKVVGSFINHPDMKIKGFIRRMEKSFLERRGIRIYRTDSQSHSKYPEKQEDFYI